MAFKPVSDKSRIEKTKKKRKKTYDGHFFRKSVSKKKFLEFALLSVCKVSSNSNGSFRKSLFWGRVFVCS